MVVRRRPLRPLAARRTRGSDPRRGGDLRAGIRLSYVVARRRAPAWAAAGLTALAATVAAERFTVRPEAVTLGLLGVYLLLLDRPLTWARAVLLVGLQVVWANTHALSVLGLVPLGATLVAALASRWFARGEPIPLGPIVA